MKIAAVVLAAGLLATGAVHAADAGEELMKKSGCTACHAIDKKVVGPAYKEVAAKYRGNAGARRDARRKGEEGWAGRLGPGADAAELDGVRRRHQDAGRLHPRAEIGAAGAARAPPL